MKYYEWTKKLGQKHWSKSNSPTTICGKPMLGNNYASLINEENKTPCEECLTQMDTVDLNKLENNLKQVGLNVIVFD